MTPRETIEAALRSLGDTADNVAASLRRLGITGDTDRCQTCPLARFVQGVWGRKYPGTPGGARVYTHDGGVYADGGDAKRICDFDLPPGCVGFVAAFDDDAYADLIRTA